MEPLPGVVTQKHSLRGPRIDDLTSGHIPSPPESARFARMRSPDTPSICRAFVSSIGSLERRRMGSSLDGSAHDRDAKRAYLPDSCCHSLAAVDG